MGLQLIFPSYEKLKEEGLLGDKPPSKPNFFSARILADEALASRVGCRYVGFCWTGTSTRGGCA